ncbi:hypothetical protein PFISCL1PPCAC_12058, partial [Pristionchus fissidentatus]
RFLTLLVPFYYSPDTMKFYCVFLLPALTTPLRYSPFIKQLDTAGANSTSFFVKVFCQANPAIHRKLSYLKRWDTKFALVDELTSRHLLSQLRNDICSTDFMLSKCLCNTDTVKMVCLIQYYREVFEEFGDHVNFGCSSSTPLFSFLQLAPLLALWLLI